MQINDNIYLIGFMGTGKSTIGKLLAQKLGAVFLDTDEIISEKEKLSIPHIFEKYGESYFRDLESSTISELSNRAGLVVSTGGGIVIRPQNVDLMQNSGTVVLLEAEAQTILQRLEGDNSRPLLSGSKTVESIGELLERRHQFYEKVHQIKIDTNNKSIDEIVDEILKNMRCNYANR